MRRSIIVGIDGSAEAAGAARVASLLAHDLDRRLVLAHVTNDPPVFPFGDSWARTQQRREAITEAGRLFDAVSRDVGEPMAKRRVVFRDLTNDGIADRLRAVSREEDADLIVVGSRRRGPLVRALLGSVSASLSTDGVCPVVVVPSEAAEHRPDPAARFGPIVCAVDGSPESDRAQLLSEQLADRLGVSVLPVFVDPKQPPVGGAMPAVAQLASRADARLIAVGTPKRQPLLGSASSDLMSRSGTPLLLVPSGAPFPRLNEPEAPAVPLAA
jgi:nucleotide-binding universal stress UspA family protein